MKTDESKQKIADLSNSVMQGIKDLRDLKANNPDQGSGFYAGNAGSILNAYREGDLTFEEAVKELDSDKTKLLAAIKSAMRIEGLWCPDAAKSRCHEDEIFAIQAVRNTFAKLLSEMN